MKVAILGNQARAMSNFWTVLIRRLIADGHEVLCLVPVPGPQDDIAWEVALLDLGVQLTRYPLDRKGINVKNDLKTLWFLRGLLKRHQPDIVFSFTIKPVIYGSLAARLARYPRKQGRYAMITGLGYVFEADSQGKKLLFHCARMLYRLALGSIDTVFFQNQEDRALFEKLRIVPKTCRIAMSKGTGVDVGHFAYTPASAVPPEFLFVGRLIEAKGLYDLRDAAQRLKAKHPEVRIGILGPEEHGLGSVPLSEVLQWQEQGLVTYYGETRDVRPYLAQAGVVVLPSWREGTPCSLMEAMSMGKAVIAADAPGSREVVRHGENGLLVPIRHGAALAEAMERFIVEPDLAIAMGAAGRKIAENEFDAEVVAAHILSQLTATEANHVD